MTRIASLFAALVAFALVACGAEPAPSCGAIGRSAPCACPGGAQGAQECGPLGVFSACICPDGGGLEAGADADAAPADAGPDNGADVTTEAGGDAAPMDAPVCPPGFADCDRSAANGCETDLRASITSCGACGTICQPAANATPACVAGACRTTCSAGFADCNDQPGCETDVTTVLNCGGCGASCPVGGGFRCCPRSETNRCPRADQPCQ